MTNIERLCPECKQGKTINCTLEYLDGDDLRTCATQMATAPDLSADQVKAAPDEFAFVRCSDGALRPAFRRLRALDSMPSTKFVAEWEFASGGRRRVDESESMSIDALVAEREQTLRAQIQLLRHRWVVGEIEDDELDEALLHIARGTK